MKIVDTILTVRHVQVVVALLVAAGHVDEPHVVGHFEV